MILKPPFLRLRWGHPLTNGLVSCAPFYEGSGGILNDISGRNNNGILTNMNPATDWVGSPYGWALDFDGTDDGVHVSNQVWAANEPKTVIVRFKTATTGRTLVAAGQVIQMFISGTNQFQSWMGNTVWSVTCTGIANGNWHHLAYIYNGTQESLFYDGLSVGTPNVEASPSMASSTMFIGRGTAAGEYLNGQIESCLVYNRALSALEIAELYHNPNVIYEQNELDWIANITAGGTGKWNNIILGKWNGVEINKWNNTPINTQ